MACVAPCVTHRERFEMDKKLLKEARDNLSLHTMLLIREGKSKAIALAMAYAEGSDGLNRRLGQQSLLPLLSDPAPSAATEVKHKAA